MKTHPTLPSEFTRQLRAYGASAAGRTRVGAATRWIGYTAAAGIAFTLTPDLEAVPVFGAGPLTVVYTAPNGAATVQANLDGDANADFRFRIMRQTGVNPGGTAARLGRALATGLNPFNGIFGGSAFTAFRATAGPSFHVPAQPLGFYLQESLRDAAVPRERLSLPRGFRFASSRPAPAGVFHFLRRGGYRSHGLPASSEWPGTSF